MNFLLKVFLLGILLTPTAFATGETDRAHLGNCGYHAFIAWKLWEVSDTYGPDNIERSTTFLMQDPYLEKIRYLYTTEGGDKCTFKESGIIEHCQKADGESFDRDTFIGTIVQKNDTQSPQHRAFISCS